jgi:sulfoxide reductase heme-binding subunit YedZ
VSTIVLAPGWSAWAPWTDKKGRPHKLRAVTFVLLLLPGLWLALRYVLGMLGPRSLNELIHGAGYWTVWLLLASLMVSPAKAILGMPNLIVIRRMVGNAALSYGLIHLSLYMADQKWKLGVVVSEIVLRFYLTIGFIALSGLIVLGVTSTDGWVRRLGKRWKRLHRIVYGIGVLGLIHYALQTKADASLPLLGAGIFYWLMLWRVLPAGRDRGPAALAGLAVAAAALTLATEWTWYRFGTHIDPMRVLRSELDVAFGLHPVGQVLALGLLVLAAVQVRAWSQGRAGQFATFWVALFAATAWVDDVATFIFGFEVFGDDDAGLGWLWADGVWAVLLGVLGFVRWLVRGSPKRAVVDALWLACLAYRVVLASNGLPNIEAAVSAFLAVFWAALAWQTWRMSKLAGLALIPLLAVLACGLTGLF